METARGEKVPARNDTREDGCDFRLQSGPLRAIFVVERYADTNGIIACVRRRRVDTKEETRHSRVTSQLNDDVGYEIIPQK